MASNTSPLSLRPWPSDTKKPKTVAEFIARVSSQGEFRNVTEASLRKQIEDEQNGIVESKDVDMRDESEADGEEEPVNGVVAAPSVEDIRKAQLEVMQHIDAAHNAALMTQDFVSLLLSKENPVQAASTLSQVLRDLVGIGTMGADKLVDSNLTDARIIDNKNVATGWKLLDLDKTIDSVMSSATRLEKEIELETKYWADVLAVKDNNWAISRLGNNQRNTLGVKFGFPESAPRFRNSSVAPMNRADDGSVSLNVSQVEDPQRVLVAVQKKGEVVGRSFLASPPAVDAPLPERVLEARNTILEQELWHEINREGRSLLAYNVRLRPSEVVITVDAETSIIFTLESLDTYERPTDEARTEDDFATKISSGLHVLLTYAHRLNKQRRSQPKPTLRTPDAPIGPAYSLLRPLIGYLTHEHSITQTISYFSSLTTILQSAGLPNAAFTVTERPLTLRNPQAPQWATAPDLLCNALLSPQNFAITFTITPTARIQVRGVTTFAPICTQYFITALPALPNDSVENTDEWKGTVAEVFPPIEGQGQVYPDLREVTYYIRQAVARVLARRAEAQANPSTQTPHSPRWMQKTRGCGIENGSAEIEFVLGRAADSVDSAEKWASDQSKPSGMWARAEVPDAEELARSGEVGEDLTPVLVVYAARPMVEDRAEAIGGAGDASQTRMWVWKADGRGEGSVDGVVRGFVAGGTDAE